MRTELFRCAQGKNREPGLQAFCVSKTTGRQILYCPPFRTLHLLQGFLLAVSKQTALLAAGFERRSVVFVCAPNYSAVRKAKTASPACRRFVSAKRPEGKSCTAHHLTIKSTPIYWGCFFVPWAVSKQTALLAAGFECAKS